NILDQDNVAITGEGTVDGQGKPFWDSYWALRKDYEAKGLRWIVDYDAKRPRLLVMANSSNVTVKDVTLQRSGFWTVHVLYSKNVTVDGITVRNNVGGHGPSTDGIDIVHLRLRNLGRHPPRHCPPPQGQGYQGGHQLQVRPHAYSTLPGGYTEATLPAHWKAMLTKVDPAQGLPHFHNVVISNVKVQHAKTAISAAGQSNSLLENITLDNVTMTAATAGSITYAKDWNIKNVIITAQDEKPVAVQNSSKTVF
nr:hypothetical protein [Tanacetum cinerariifolium]